jgi:glutamate dehydrogenase/leucine dehydrogenase
MSTHYIDNFADDFGPEKVVHLYEPKSQLRAIVVIDNISLGPAVGGCRMAADVSTREVARLARTMTLKNALADLPHGGAKSAILEDPNHSNKEKLIRAFALAIKSLTDYIPGPDMGTDETCMAYIHDEIGRAVGLPKTLGGLPLDKLGMTGYGLSVVADEACEHTGMSLEGARVIIQGFGNVGKAAARFLMQRGIKLIATCDSNFGIYNPDGLDILALINTEFKETNLRNSCLGKVVDRDAILGIESDIFIPAARPDVFTEANQHLLNTKLVLEGANIPITHEAAKNLHDRGILIIPDIIANSGGVICAATEYQGLSESNAFDRAKATIKTNVQELLKRVRDEHLPPHAIALQMAQERITNAMTYRAHM